MADQDASDLHFDAMTSRPLRREALRRKTSSYSRSNMVKAGWATVGGETSPDKTTLWRVLVRTSSPAPRPADCISITVPAVAFEEKPIRRTLVDPRLHRNA